MNHLWEFCSQVQSGWHALRRQPRELVGGFLIVALLTACSMGLLGGPLAVAYARLCLRAVRGGRVSLRDLLESARHPWPGLAVGIAFLLVVRFGFLFGAGVGTLVAFAAGYAVLWAAFFLADGESSAIAAVALSVRLNLSHWVTTLALYGAVLFCASINPVLGLAVMPLAAEAMASCYLRVTGRAAGLL